GNELDPEPVTRRHHVGECLSSEEVQSLLRADEAHRSQFRCDAMCLIELCGREIAATDGAHLSGADQAVQRGQRFANRDGRVWQMQLVQVDPIGLETAQAVVDSSGDPLRARAPELWSGRWSDAELGRDQGLVTPASQGAAQVFLREAPRWVGLVPV